MRADGTFARTSKRSARPVAEVGAGVAEPAGEDGDLRVRLLPTRLTLVLLTLLLAHAAGIAWADRGGELLAPVVLLATGAAGLVGCALGGRGALVVLAVLSACLGHQALARELGRARADALLVEGLDPKAIRLVDARVAARRATGFGEEVELVAVRSRAGDVGVPRRLVLAIPAGASRAERLLWPGAAVRIGVAISALRPPRNPGSPDREHALARQGLAARARLLKPDWVVERIPVGDPVAGLGAALARMRRDVVERVGERFAQLGGGEDGTGEAAGAGLVRALALGDRRGLSDETRRSFRQLGLAHLISVSGLHIGFVALPAAWWILRARTLWRPPKRPVLGFAAPVIAGCLAAGSYAWLSGAGVPALRASLLFALFGISRALGIAIPPAAALAGIALALLLASPGHLFDAGAVFSFTACAALVAGGVWGPAPRPVASVTKIETGGAARSEWLASLCRVLQRSGEPLRASLAVSIGMLPLVERYGLPRSLPSPLVNAVAIPWAGFVVLPGALAASLLACLLPDEARSDGLLRALLLPAAWLERAASATAAQLPLAWIGEDLPGRLAWPWALAIGGLAFVRLRRGDARTASAAWVLLALLGIEPLRERAFEGPLPRVVFFDVGQADAALVQARDANWLIDSGSGPEDGSGGTALLRALRAEGVDRLDVLAITHGDLDHRGGAVRILSVVEVGELWLPAQAARDPALTALADAARAEGVRVRWLAAGDRAGSPDSIAVEVLWPPAPERGVGAAVVGEWVGRARNDASLVLQIALGGRRFLFAADIGESVEGRLLKGEWSLRAEVLKVAHHGSRQSSSARFLAAVSPRIAVVSAPCGAGRGLPSAPALERLRDAGAELGWTGRDGAIEISSANAGVGVEEEEGASPLRMRYWGGQRRCVPDLRRANASGWDEP